MARYQITAPNGQKFEINAPDGATEAQVMAYAQSEFAKSTQQQAAPVRAQITDVPSPEQDAAVAEYYQSQAAKPKPSRSFADKAIGAGEVALTLGTGATTGLLGQLVGTGAGIGKSIQQGLYGTNQGADMAEQVAMDTAAASTYQPRTQAGREYLGKIGEVAAPLAAIPPIREVALIGQSVRPAAQSLKARIPAKQETFKVDESLIYESPEEASKAALNKAIPPTKMADPKNPEKIINDDLAIAAKRQGFDENFVQALKNLSPADKKQVLKMATTIDRGESDFLASRFNRPSDVVGESLAARISHIKNVNKQAGKDVDLAVKSLPEVVDPQAPFEATLNRLVEMGVKFDNDDTPKFRGSEIQGSPADEKIVRDVVDRMKDVNTAKDLHNLKKYIYNKVYSGKRSEGGLLPQTERVMKDFARGINDVLGEASDDYRAANQVYSETINSLDELQSAAGKSIDLFGEGADKSLGTSVGGLLSKNKTRVKLENQIKNIDEVAKKYGGKFEDDIKTQTAIVDELEKIYGTPAKTSLGGNLDKQTQDIINRGVSGAITDKAFSMLSKSEKQRRQDSLVALKKLLMRENK